MNLIDLALELIAVILGVLLYYGFKGIWFKDEPPL